MDDSVQNERGDSNRYWLAVGLCVLVALALRLAWLGRSPFRADTMAFYEYALQGKAGLELWRNPPWPSQIPLAEATMLTFLRLTRLSANHFTVRLPFALLGTAAVLGLFFLGRRVFGARAGLVAALLGAFSPTHIYTSREAYHYVGLTCYGTYALVGFWAWWRLVRRAEKLQWRWVVLWFLANLVACHCHMSAWPFFAGQCLLLFGTALHRSRTDRRRGILTMGLLAGLVLVIGLALFPWLHSALTKVVKRTAETAAATGAHERVRVYKMAVEFLALYTFGIRWWGVTLLVALVAVSCWAVWRVGKQAGPFGALLLLFGVEFGLLFLTIRVVGKGLASRHYFSALWPLVTVLMAGGLCAVGRAAGERSRLAPRVVTWAMAALICLYCVVPVWAVVRIEGKPTPYFKIQSFLNEKLRPGSLVLVDRWLEPWCEMRVYSATNVYATFTVPNEPVKAYLGNRWRDSVVAFFEKYPDAAYLQMIKPYADHPEVGPWDWPSRQFRQCAEIRNEGGLLLRRWGLAPREDFYAANTNRLLVEVFYNTVEDLGDIRRRAGKFSLLLYGAGWGYTKLWRQIRGDFRDWRVLEERAELEIYNLTDSELAGTLALQAVALQKPKRVVLESGQGTSFPPGRLGSAKLGGLRLRPGKNVVALRDPGWSKAKTPLLVLNARFLGEGAGAK